jgi:hypothetical protein
LTKEQPKVKNKNNKIPNLANKDLIELAPFLYLSPGHPFHHPPKSAS